MGNKLFKRNEKSLINIAISSQWKKEKKYTLIELGLQNMSYNDRDLYLREMTWRYNFTYRDWICPDTMNEIVGIILIKN